MRKLSILLLILGLVLLTGLVVWQGWRAVTAPLQAAGAGLLLLPAFFLPVLALGTVAWRVLFESPERPGFGAAFYAGWVAFSVNTILPAAQIGGDAVRSRLIHKAGTPGVAAIATVVVDKTIQALSQPVFAVAGLALFALAGAGAEVLLPSALFIVLLSAGIYGFYRVQRAGMFAAMARAAQSGGRRIAPTRWLMAASALGAGAAAADDAVRAAYRDRRRFFASCLLRLAYRAMLAVEIWLAAQLLGHPIGLVDALILESLAQIAVAAAFMVPGALGVQEGGYMLLAAALGLPAELGLSLSLARRCRELVVGVPGVLVWQAHEGRIALARAPAPPTEAG